VRPADTSAEAWAVFIDLHRKMDPAQKIKTVFELSDSLWSLALASVRREYPEADDREVFLRTAARRLDAGTVRKVCGFDPDTRPK
jgi:hypothetical protein